MPEIPAGLPSALLERRPDIQQAEQALVAANAQIVVAKAAHPPSITLTAQGGLQIAALSDLFTGPAGFWSVAGGLVQPILTGGRTRATVRLTEAQAEELVHTYRRTVQQEFRERQARLAASAQDAARFSHLPTAEGTAISKS